MGLQYYCIDDELALLWVVNYVQNSQTRRDTGRKLDWLIDFNSISTHLGLFYA